MDDVIICKDIFKRIISDHWSAFKLAYPKFDSPDYNDVIRKMLCCGDPEKMGYAQYRCEYCGCIRRIAFSCKSSFCLSCAKGHTDQWVDFISRRLIPGVIYRHVVLTTPEYLRKYFRNDSALLNFFMRAGNECLKDILATSCGIMLEMGCIIVLQTAGRSGHYNPHLHILMTAGGITPDGTYNPVSYIPYDIMHRKWQFHLLSMLREHVHDTAIEKDIDIGWKDYPKGFVAYLQPGDVPPGGKGLARYLAKYVVSPPISVRRIERYDGNSVSYWYRDHKSGQVEHETLPVLQFIKRMVQHILPKGFQRIRYYGLHANVRYRKCRHHIADILPADMPDDPNGYRVLPPKPFFQRFFESFGKDPLACPMCGNEMSLELVYHADYGIIREFSLFEELHSGRPPDRKLPRRNVLFRPERLVQISLPSMRAC
jgi:hypothetical protein